jgi:hypothetical protein
MVIGHMKILELCEVAAEEEDEEEEEEAPVSACS